MEHQGSGSREFGPWNTWVTRELAPRNTGVLAQESFRPANSHCFTVSLTDIVAVSRSNGLAAQIHGFVRLAPEP